MDQPPDQPPEDEPIQQQQQMQDVTILHRGKSHSIRFNPSDSQFTLQTLIQGATAIPAGEQLLLHRGKKLVFIPDSPIEQLKLSQKAMLLHKPPPSRTQTLPSVLEPPTAALRAADKSLGSVKQALSELRQAVARHTKGFLDAQQTQEALKKDDRECRAIEERVMKTLEDVDGIEVPKEKVELWRSERRAVVNLAQTILKDVDDLNDRIGKLLEDRWGEVEKNRGRR